MHRTDGEVGLPHFLRQPVHLPLGVAKDDGLGNGEGVVQVAQCVKLPLFTLYSDEKLLDTFKSQLVTLDQDPDGITHELRSHLEDLVGQGGGDEQDLGGGWEVTVDVVDLFLEAFVQHLVSLIKDEHFEAPGTQCPPSDHVKDTTRCTRDNMLAKIELADVFAQVGSTNASMALDIHVVTESQNDLLDLDGQLTSR